MQIFSKWSVKGVNTQTVKKVYTMPNGNGRTRRKDSIGRAIKTIQALGRPTGVTATELRAILGLSANGSRSSGRCNAMRWIDAASVHLPVAEIGKRRNGGNTRGPYATVYGIMD